jgi:hypothetical protein
MRSGMVRRLLALAVLSLACACARGSLSMAPDEQDAGTSEEESPSSSADGGADAAVMDGGHGGGDGDGDGDGDGPEEDASAPEKDAGTTPEEHDAGSAALVPSGAVGGTGGGAFDDSLALPETPQVKSISIWTGDRVDRIQLELRTGQVFGHGGTGGSEHKLELAQGEAIISARLCTGVHDATTSLHYARFGTNLGHELSGGNQTDTCTNFMAPEGRQIGGLFGREGNELDALGFFYTRLPAP